MKIILQIDGGIGKSIMATAVCKAIKTHYPDDKLIVITGYPEVFLCNPHVDKVFNHQGLSYFYQDYIAPKDIKMCLHNPYLETAFIKKDGHVIKVWCEMFGVPYSGELPELFINQREQSFYGHQFASQKPLLLLHTNGGGKDQPNKYSWARDMPLALAQQVVYAFAQDYHIVHIRRDDQLALQGVTPIQADFRALAVLLSMSAKRLLIDSFAQHAAAALGMPSTVLWVANVPSQFGYGMHTNIIANPPTLKPELRNAIYSEFNIGGAPIEFPYRSEAELFNTEQVINAVQGGVPFPQPEAAQMPHEPAAIAPELVHALPEEGKKNGKSKKLVTE